MNIQTIKEQAKRNAVDKKKTTTAKLNSKADSKEITRIIDISKNVIKEYYRHSCKEDKEWIRTRMTELMQEKGMRKYFVSFRSEFAHKFFPEIFDEKKKRVQKTLLDEFDEIDTELESNI